jgi:aryl-alcohol dehydrogenase-like predicted oxidoreductase
MKYARLGNTWLEVSRTCLGCMSYGDPQWRSWVLDDEAARPHFKRALEHGINFFDTADMYSVGASEEVTGRALGDMASRHDYVLASKVHYPVHDGPNRSGLSRKHILEGCDESLKRLGVDFIDLYQIHRWDPASPVAEVAEALDSLVRAGKVRYLGASSMAAWQFSRALHVAGENGWHQFVSMQNHYNLVYREEEREMIPLCMDQGVGVIPWSPLARGFLTGSRSRDGEQRTTRSRSDDFADAMYFEESDFKVLDAVLEVSKERGIKAAQVAFAWLLSVPGITAPIIGATKVDYIDDAVAALDVKLSEEEISRLEAPYTPHAILGHDQPTVRPK